MIHVIYNKNNKIINYRSGQTTQMDHGGGYVIVTIKISNESLDWKVICYLCLSPRILKG